MSFTSDKEGETDMHLIHRLALYEKVNQNHYLETVPTCCNWFFNNEF